MGKAFETVEGVLLAVPIENDDVGLIVYHDKPIIMDYLVLRPVAFVSQNGGGIRGIENMDFMNLKGFHETKS